MLPLRDDVPSRSTPFVVVCLIVANALVFLLEISLVAAEGGGSGALAEFTDAWGLVPREFLRGTSQRGPTGQIVWLTPIAAMFIHGGLLHLAGNLLYLWIFGRRIEDLLGHGRFFLFYLVCGLAAAGGAGRERSEFVCADRRRERRHLGPARRLRRLLPDRPAAPALAADAGAGRALPARVDRDPDRIRPRRARAKRRVASPGGRMSAASSPGIALIRSMRVRDPIRSRSRI